MYKGFCNICFLVGTSDYSEIIWCFSPLSWWKLGILDQFHPTNEKCVVSCASTNFIIGLFIFTLIYVTGQLPQILKVNKTLRHHIDFPMLDREGSII